MQPADVAVVLRRRTPWQAIDLGLAMLQRWRRPVYAAWSLTFLPFAALCLLLAWARDAAWLALALIWWLKPLFDRVLLHVLSRAVFGEVLAARDVVRAAREWLATGLFTALTFGRFDFARSFNLPVRQLEGQTGRAARERRAVLWRRTRGYAVWLTVVCLHFEGALMFSGDLLLDVFLPAKADTGRDYWEMLFRGEADEAFSFADALAYALVVTIIEPLYVAAGFALYVNRRTLLEGWDIEVALRRIAERRAQPASAARAMPPAAAAVLLLATLACLAMPQPVLAQQKDAKREIAEVLKAPEFQQYRETTHWRRSTPVRPSDPWFDPQILGGIGHAIARTAEVLLWVAAIALAAFALWWAARQLPRGGATPREAYQPPPALFGLELAPETLPQDIPGAALALAREGRMREALSLLYRGALSELVHKRGVELRSSDTEGEALRRVRARTGGDASAYFALLVAAWQAAAYAGRDPKLAEVEHLAADYAARFAPRSA